jgi:hypothetical protein
MTQRIRTPLIALFLVGMLALHVLLAWRSRDLVRKGYPDFTIFYSAGKIVRQGLGPLLYNEQTQYRIQQEFAAGVSIRQGPLPYNHPPFEALIFAPFTWLSYPTAYLLWDFVNLLVLFSLPFLLRPHLPMLRHTPVMAWLFASLAFFPVFIALLQGQDIILLLLLFTLAFISLKKNSDFGAGCWLGLGLFRFHLVLPLMFILLLQKRRRAVLGFVLIGTALAALSVAVVGWETTLSYPSYVWHVEQSMEQRRTIIPIGVPNLRGLLDSVPGLFISKTLRGGILALISTALLFFTAFKWAKTGAGMFDLRFCLYVVVTLLVGYHAFAYDLSLLVLPIALLANYLLERGQISVHSRVFQLGSLFLLFFTPLQMLLLFRNGRYSLMALVLLVWGWGLVREISQQEVIPRRKAAEPASA